MKKLKYIFIGGLLATTVSCTKGFLDINTSPNQPSKVTLTQLLSTTEQGLAYSMGFSASSARGAVGLTEVLAVYMHQVTVRESQDQYGATGDEFNINNCWSQFYSSQSTSTEILGFLENCEVMIRQGDQSGNAIYAGIGRVMKAYGLSQFVDVFADVPFSEANKFSTTGVRYPKFDKGQDIYPELLKMLDTAITNLNDASAANTLTPEADDVFYNGDTEKWTKLANTIKLKLYAQQRLVTDVSAQVNALLSSGNLISSTEESWMMNYSSNISPDDRNPGFNDYYATQRSHYMSPWFYEILKGYNKNIFTGIEDPRIPYYFYNQNTRTGRAQNRTDYRDSAFISILFGSQGPGRDGSQDRSMTVFGIYPVGGRFDDNYLNRTNNPVVVSSSTASGAAPLRLLTYADVLYIKAELQNVGIVAGDARATLQQAMDESFKMVDFVVNRANRGQNIPVLAGSATVQNYTNKILGVYDARNAAGKLEVIMTQKWIQSFGFSCDQYTDYRRTGYPVLFNPNDPSMAPAGLFQPPVLGDPSIAGQQPAVKVALGRNYPLSLPWPSSELNVNSNAPAQKTPDSYPVFWDK